MITMTAYGIEHTNIFTSQYSLTVYFVLAAFFAWLVYRSYQENKALQNNDSVTRIVQKKLQQDGCLPDGDIHKKEYIEFKQIGTLHEYIVVFYINQSPIRYGLNIKYEQDASLVTAVVYKNVDIILKSGIQKVDSYDVIGNYVVQIDSETID